MGYNSGTITDSYATGAVTGKGTDPTGGLVGENSGDITDSYATGTVTGRKRTGGLVGSNWVSGTITNSHATGAVTGTWYTGGLVGDNAGGTISNSFWDTDTSGQFVSAGGTGKTTAEMLQSSTFIAAGWDYENIWQQQDGETYPYFMGQTINIPIPVVAVTGVTLDKSTMNLVAGGATGQLVATVEPANATDKSVTWSSDNTTVATVDANGTVTPVAAGTATITVTTTDGGYTAACIVTLSEAPIAVTGVTLDQTSLNLTIGDTPIPLTATVSPADATDKSVTWSSANTAVATVAADGTVTPVAAGTATITVTTTDGGHTATCAVTVVEWLPGDANRDGKIDAGDLADVAAAFNTREGDENWNPAADLNNDGIVDIYDLVIVGKNFG